MKNKTKAPRFLRSTPVRTSKSGIKAPKKLRRTPVSGKQVLLTLIRMILLLLWVWAVITAVQWVLARVMIWIFGQETMQEVVWTAVYSALSYVIAFAILLLVTPRLDLVLSKEMKGGKAPRKAKKSAVGGEEEEKVVGKAELSVSAGAENVKIMSREELGLKGLPTWMDIGLAPVGYVIAIFLAAALSGLLGQIFPWFDAEQSQALSFSPYIWGVDRLIAFIVLVVVAPIAEELIFRGWLYGKLRAQLAARLGNKWSVVLAILAVSILFGIMHGQWNVGVTVFVLSVVMCVLREITGTIYAGILVHMIKNGLAFYLLYVMGVGL